MAATKGLVDFLFMAACEWFLMFWMFIHAALSYYLSKFARYCELQIPCMLCSRIDHFFGNEEESVYHFDLFCNKHQLDISYMLYCNLHNELVDVREICEDCFNSVTLQSQSNLESFGFVVGAMGREREGYRRSYLNKNFVCAPSGIRTCSCCERQKSSGECLINRDAVGPRFSKVTTKPPLPRVARRGKSRQKDSLKRMRNKVKHRHRDVSSSAGYPDLKFVSDSEFDFIFSDDDNDGGFYMVGIGERRSNDDSIVRGSTKGQNRSKGLGMHSYSTPDLGTALLLEAQLNEISRTRSASVTPGSYLRKTKERDPLKARKYKKPSSSSMNSTMGLNSLTSARSGHGSLDGSVASFRSGNYNRNNVFSRHSYSASDLESALLELQLNSLPHRSASLTPASSYSVEPSSLENFQFHLPRGVKSVPQKAKKNRKSSSSANSIRRSGSSTNVRSGLSTYYSDKTNGYGHSDDSVISRNTGSHHRHKIPRRHSCSVFQLGCEILLNMPPDEPNGYVSHGFEEPKFYTMPSHSHSPEVTSFYPMSFPPQSSADVRNDLSSLYTNKTKGYGSLDDSVVSRNTSNQHQNNIPRRHSYSFFEMGCEILLNMPGDESLTSRSVYSTQNGSVGYGFGEPEMLELQTRPTRNTNKTNWYGSSDDSVLSRNTGGNHLNTNPRRHSYSAFELGCALLLNTRIDEGLTNHSASSLAPNCPISHGLGEQKPKFHTRPSSSRSPELGSLNMLQIPTHNGSQDQNKIPRRHSYSAFDLGCALLLEMQRDESLTRRSASVVPNGPVDHGFGERKPKFQAKPSCSHSHEHNSLNTMQFPMHNNKKDSSYSNKTKKHGSLDDSVVLNRMGHQNQNKNPRRHSYSAFDLGGPLFVEMLLDDSLTGLNPSFAPTHATGHGFEELNCHYSSKLGSPNAGQFHHHKVRRDKNPLPLPHPIKGLGPSSLDDSVVSRNKCRHNQNRIPRRHSYSVLQLGGDILLNMPTDESLTSDFVSLALNDPYGHGYGESQKSIFQMKHSPSHSPEISSHNVMQSHPQKSGRDKNHLPPIGSVKRFSSSSDVRNDSSSEFLDESKWRGSLDDLIVSRSTCHHNQNEVPRRHSYSAFDLGRALLVEMHLDESLKRCYASMTPNDPSGHNLRGHNPPHSSEFDSFNVVQSHHRRAKRDKNLPLPYPVNRSGSSSGVRTHGNRSLDDSIVSHNMCSHNHNQNKNPRRHSYSTFELGLLLDMQRDRSRSASLTPGLINYGSEELKNSMMHTKPNNYHHSLDSSSLNVMQFAHKKAEENHRQFLHHWHDSFDDSIVSHDRDSRKRYRNLARNSYSVSDLTSPLVLKKNEGLTSKSASLTPNCSVGEDLGELNWSKFQIQPSSCSPEFSYHDDMEPVLKRKKVDRPKTKESNKTLRSANNVKTMSSSANRYGFFDDSVSSNDMGSQNRFKIFSRNSQSATDLGSALLEMHLDDSVRSRSKSLTPNCSVEHGFTEQKWPKSQIKSSPSYPSEPESFAAQFTIGNTKGHDPLEVEKDKKPFPPMHPTREMDSLTNIKSDLCPTCLDKIDVRSFDGSSVFSEMEVDGCIEKVKKQAEDDVRCMRLLQSELEAERNAATIAANHAMNMITRLQQEKAALQMEALQYLRMMEEQAEYDMEALQKANELVEEKENEIQDLLDELDHYRSRFSDESTRNVHVPVTNLEDEKRYILESLSKLEKKLHQLSLQSGHSNDGNNMSYHKDSLISNGVYENSQENVNHADHSKKMVSNDGIEADLAIMEHEIAQMKTKMEALQTEVELLKHACNTLHGNDGLEFIQEIAHQLQDLRQIMFDRRYISSN